MSEQPRPPAPRRLPVSGADLLLMVIVGFGSSRFLLPLMAGALNVQIRDGVSNIAAVMFLLTVQSLVLFAVVYAVAIRWRGVTWGELGFVPPPPGWLPRALLTALVSFPVVGAISWAQQQITGKPFENPQFEVMAPAAFAWRDYLVTLFVVSVVAPLVEETAFRGLLYRWLYERIGFYVAVAASAFMFSILHGIPALIPGIMALGAILAWTYHRTESIWVPVMVHGAYNAVVTTALYAALAQGLDLPRGG